MEVNPNKAVTRLRTAIEAILDGDFVAADNLIESARSNLGLVSAPRTSATVAAPKPQKRVSPEPAVPWFRPEPVVPVVPVVTSNFMTDLRDGTLPGFATPKTPKGQRRLEQRLSQKGAEFAKPEVAAYRSSGGVIVSAPWTVRRARATDPVVVLPPEQVARILSRLEAREAMTSIGGGEGVSRHTVSAIGLHYGVLAKDISYGAAGYTHIKTAEGNRILSEWESGKDVNEIAADHGRLPQTIQNFLDRQTAPAK